LSVMFGFIFTLFLYCFFVVSVSCPLKSLRSKKVANVRIFQHGSVKRCREVEVENCREPDPDPNRRKLKERG